MKRIMRVLMMSFVITISIVVMISLSFAVDPIKPKTGTVDTESLRKPISVPLPDLIVIDIFGRNCPDCGCGGTNFQNHPMVEYQEGIDVTIKNQGLADSGPCTLRIEYYDVISGRTAVFTIPVPGLRRGEERSLGGISGGFLYRKSSGINATIDSTSVVPESNEGNNTKTVKECKIRLI